MKNKEVYSIVVTMLLLGLAISAVPTMAEDFNSVYGDLYINNVKASSGITVRLTFDETPEEITDLTDSNGYYQIDFTGHNWETGLFFVNLGGNWYTPTPFYVDIELEKIDYPIDLYVEITNNPPNTPSNPNPSNGASGVSLNKDISWVCTDPDGDSLTFDIYFGTNPDPPLVKSDHSSKSYNQGSMIYLTKYYWKIVAKDDKGAITEGPVWSFTVQAEPSGGGGDGGGGGGLPVVNVAPVADASLSEIAGIVGESVDFDGSESYDSDGTITDYSWDFGDGETDSGETTTHTYESEGIYSVELTVEDNLGATDSTTFDVTISAKPNTPPEAPTITGTKMGTKDVPYDYTFVSTDEDDDDLSYDIDWGDETTPLPTDFYPSGTDVVESHSFSLAGVYIISASAYDNETSSGTTEFEVLIDAWWVKEIGLLLDYDANGVYEKFLSNSTDVETDTNHRSDGKYLIDDDGDDKWDWIYDKETDTLTAYSASEEKADYTIWYILILLIILILIILGYLAGRKKKKPEEPKTEPKKPSDNPGSNPGKKKTTPKKKK